MKAKMLSSNFDPNVIRISNVAVFINNQILFLNLHNDPEGKMLRFRLLAYPFKKPQADLYVTIKLEQGDICHCKTIKPIVMTSESGDEDFDEVEGECCMNVPQSFLPKFINETNALRWSYSFLTL